MIQRPNHRNAKSVYFSRHLFLEFNLRVYQISNMRAGNVDGVITRAIVSLINTTDLAMGAAGRHARVSYPFEQDGPLPTEPSALSFVRHS